MPKFMPIIGLPLHWLPLLLCLVASAIGLATAAHEERKPEAGAVSICHHCHCHKNMVVCDFNYNTTLDQIWDKMYLLPTNVTSIKAKLSGRTKFELRSGFFQDNRVNSLTIMGNTADPNDQVELTEKAFSGNHAGYPDIHISSVPNVYVRTAAFSGGESIFQVTNASELVLYPGAFTNVNVSCHFTGVTQLTMQENAFRGNGQVRLRIEHSNMELLQPFGMSMKKITIKNSRIGSIQSNAFDVTNIQQLQLHTCHIERIETQAFTNKLFSDLVSIQNSTINSIDSEAIAGSGISRLILENNTIETIGQQAINMHSVDVRLQGNSVRRMGKHWLQLKEVDYMVIEHNRFADFAPMLLEQSKKSNCSFNNNYLQQAQPGSLNFSRCELHNIKLQQSCSCDNSALTALSEHDLRSELLCTLDGHLERCFRANYVPVLRYVREACDEPRATLRCADNSTMIYRNGVYLSKDELERQKQGISIFYIVPAVMVGLIVLLIITILVIRITRRSCSSSSSSTTIPADFNRCCMDESAHNVMHIELNKQPPRVNPAQKRALTKLLANKLPADQCAETITYLMQQDQPLPEQLNRVLSDHMQQAHRKCNEMTTTVVLPSLPSVPEHIYEEPQRPLLPNDGYEDPADLHRDDDTQYATPVNARDMPPAYEPTPEYALPVHQTQLPQLPSSSHPPYAQPYHHQHKHTLPHHSTNRPLPDVLFRSQQAQQPPPPPAAAAAANNVCYATPIFRTTTLAEKSVRNVRQDLEASQHFRPNQLSSERNQRQPQLSSFPRRPLQQHKRSHNTAAAAAAAAAADNNNSSSSGGSNTFDHMDGAASLAAMEHMDMVRLANASAASGSASATPDSGSDHSGGSNETVKIDDVIEYADA